MTCGVYVIRNKENDKEYVGSSVNIELRIRQHLSHKRGGGAIVLMQALEKYGKECFEWEIIERTELLKEREKYWIAKLSPEYNLMKVIERDNPDDLGWCASQETRQKMSEACIRRGAIPPSAKGIPQTEEHRRKIGVKTKGNKSRTGYKNTPEATEKVRQALLGRKRPQSVIDAMRKAATGRRMTPEQVEANRLRNTGAGNAMYGKKKPAEEIERRLKTFYRKRIVRTLENFVAKLH